MIFARPLKYVLGKIVPFGQFETIPIENLPADVVELSVKSDGSLATSDSDVTRLVNYVEGLLEEQKETNKLLRKIYNPE